jgi:hypothetical protein
MNGDVNADGTADFAFFVQCIGSDLQASDFIL